VGLRLACSQIARLGDTVYDSDGVEVGVITSGTFSPALDCSIAMAQVSLSAAGGGAVLQVELASADGKVAATVTDLPFVPATG
jgi:aminomethyltransferase